MRGALISLTYLFAACCFILALKWLSHPTTARRGVLAGEIGMAAAIIATLFKADIVEYQWVLVALVLGSAVGDRKSVV